VKSRGVLLAVVFVVSATFGGVSVASAQVDQGAYGQGPGAVGVAPSQPSALPGVASTAPGVASTAPGVASTVPGVASAIPARGTGLVMGVELPRTGGVQESGMVVSGWQVLTGLGLVGLLVALQLGLRRNRYSALQR
jgi:hypothetical protein